MWTAFFIAQLALAADTTAEPGDATSTVVVPDRAEYQRLSEEMEKLVAKNAWMGVEKAYVQLVATGVSPSFADHVSGAHAARALGDVLATRNRLIAANTQREDRAVLDWLYEIDSNYNRVFLACDPSTRSIDPAAMPFDPNQKRSVELAQVAISDAGLFDGYLPAGEYQFGDMKIKVEPRVQSVSIDVRTEEWMRELERREKKEEKKNK
ncbi:MAG: hypothetical protein H0V89_07135 [Deltaproteobacteria bacterium]|nr:hypothetical protein [Deltaproteobacteria bacterium]